MTQMPGPTRRDPCRSLDSAMELFWDKGYEGVHVAEVVEALGTCRQTLYKEFGDKAGLYRATLQRYVDEREAECREEFEAAPSPGVGLRRQIESWSECAKATPGGCFLAAAMVDRAPHDPEVAQLVLDAWARRRALLSEQVAAAQAAGEVPARLKPVEVADLLVAVAHGLAAHATLPGSAEAIDRVIQGALAVLGLDSRA